MNRNQDECEALERIFRDLSKHTNRQLAEIWESLGDKEISQHPAFQTDVRIAECTIALLSVSDGERKEKTAYTQILAWIFQHGYEQAPIRSFLNHLYDAGQFPFPPHYKFSEIEAEAGHVLSDRSGKQIDVWITGLARKNIKDVPIKWLIVVEVKVDTLESLSQLGCYEKEATKWATASEKAGDKYIDPIFVCLTRAGKAAKWGKQNWWPITFEQICGLIWDSIKDREDAPSFCLAGYFITAVLAKVCEWPIPLPRSIVPSHLNRYSLLSFFGKSRCSHEE